MSAFFSGMIFLDAFLLVFDTVLIAFGGVIEGVCEDFGCRIFVPIAIGIGFGDVAVFIISWIALSN